MNRFVIVAVPRSGSNLLCTLLNSHPEILCHHEVFNPQGIFTARNEPTRTFELGTMEQRDAAPLDFLSRVWGTEQGHAAVGFKWTRGQNEAVLDHVVQTSSIRTIILRRQNRVKTYISEQIARRTQQWEVYDRRELQQPRPQIEVSLGDLMAHIAVNDCFYRELTESLDAHAQEYLELEYEGLFDPQNHERVLRFLGVDDSGFPLRASSIKQNPTDLRHLVRNYNELESRMIDPALQAELSDCGM